MPYSATIETQSDECGDGWYIEDLEMHPADFIVKVRHEGGVMMPFRDGIAAFIPYEEIRQIWFGNGEEHVCDHCQEEPTPEKPKDLTVN